MKKIEAIIRESKMGRVRDALELKGLHGMTVSHVQGLGAQAGRSSTYRGAEFRVDFVPRVKLEIVVDDKHAHGVVDTIYETARTGEVGDGRIMITDLESVIHIRTGETHDSLSDENRSASSLRPRKTARPRSASPTFQQSV